MNSAKPYGLARQNADITCCSTTLVLWSPRRWDLLPAETLDPSAGFFQLGMDSLMSVTLQRALSDSLGEFLPASVVFDYPTVYSLTDYLATILPEFLEPEAPSGRTTADAYDEFTESELLDQLSERLRGTQ
uniref:L518_F2_22 n=1 Tax=Mycobacterium leprae TaxID=1769 RepID=Q49937_MYCLR|nr:L518_F2_22 [Mycobacterium leprae]